MNVLDFPRLVQPAIRIVGLPERLPAETGPTADEPFWPSPADLAYYLAFAAARMGEPAQSPRSLDRHVRSAHFAGTRDGTALYHLKLEAWVASAERDRMEVAPAGPIMDRDMYRPGCVS